MLFSPRAKAEHTLSLPLTTLHPYGTWSYRVESNHDPLYDLAHRRPAQPIGSNLAEATGLEPVYPVLETGASPLNA